MNVTQAIAVCNRSYRYPSIVGAEFIPQSVRQVKVSEGLFLGTYAYRESFKHHISECDIHLIERASEYCCPVGEDRFCQQIEEKVSIKFGQAARGRPKKMVEK